MKKHVDCDLREICKEAGSKECSYCAEHVMFEPTALVRFAPEMFKAAETLIQNYKNNCDIKNKSFVKLITIITKIKKEEEANERNIYPKP